MGHHWAGLNPLPAVSLGLPQYLPTCFPQREGCPTPPMPQWTGRLFGRAQAWYVARLISGVGMLVPAHSTARDP